MRLGSSSRACDEVAGLRGNVVCACIRCACLPPFVMEQVDDVIALLERVAARGLATTAEIDSVTDQLALG